MSKKISELTPVATLEDSDILTALDISAAPAQQNVRFTKATLLQDQATQAALDAHKTSGDHDARYYTQAQIDVDLALKADQAALDAHKTSSDHDSRYYTESESDAALALKADQAALNAHKTSSDHDTRYYTETEMDSALAGKEPTISPKNSGFNKPFGSTSGTVVEGNDPRILGNTLHAALTDTALSGHPGTVITISGGLSGNAVTIAPDGTLQDGGTPPGGGAGLPEAPQDGTRYGRQDASWVADPIQDDAPNDGNPKLRRTLGGISSWLASGSSAVLNVGIGAGTVAEGDAPANAVSAHAAGADVHPISGVTGLQSDLDGKEPTISPKNSAFNVDFAGSGSTGTASRSDHTHVTLPTSDQKNAMDAAAAPTGANAFATMADVGGGGGIPDAPVDGTRYGRQDAGWVADPVQTDTEIPTVDQKAAMDAAAAPAAGNAFATMGDLGGVKPPLRSAPVASPTTWDTELDESCHVYQCADAANLATWSASLPAGGDAATNEHSCSIDFLPPPSGTWTMTIPGAWNIMSGFQPLTLISTDPAATVILRALPDGTIQIYGSEAA